MTQTQISLRTYVSKLAQCELEITQQTPDPAFAVKADSAPGHIWPEVRFGSASGDAQAILITAPGAMGKTAASHAISAHLNCPLIDLAKLPVGSDSLTGLLTRVLGWGQAAQFITSLHQGQATLVLDSVDEAQLLAGQEHFQAFLRNVAELVSGTGKSKPRLVILGRKDAAETTLLMLDSLGVSCLEAQIAPLDHRRSTTFIDSYLDNNLIGGEPYRVHQTAKQPFGELREMVLADIAGALLGETVSDAEARWQEIEGFMGYPPVLMSLANRLAVGNPAAMKIRAETGAPRSHSNRAQRGEILRGVVEQILDREQTKVQARMGAILGLNDEDKVREVLYTREEQIARVLRYLDPTPEVPLTIPASLSDAQKAIYEDQIEAFVPDHPFLAGRQYANVVFEDYVRAFFDTSPTVGLQTHAELIIGGSVHGVGPFYCHFCQALLPRTKNASASVLESEELIGGILQSFVAGARNSTGGSYLHVDQHAHLDLEEEPDNDSDIPSRLSFHVESPSGVVELRSPLSNMIVVTRYGLILSSFASEFELGYGVMIVADQLQIKAGRFVVRGVPEGSGNATSMMVAVSEVQHEPTLTVTAYPKDCLLIHWREPWHQWLPYYRPGPIGTDLGDALAWQVMMGLRRILTAFHRRAQDDPTIVWERLSGFTIGRNKLFGALLECLVELQVVTRTASKVHTLRLSKLGEYGVSYRWLFDQNFTKALEGLYLAVIKTEKFQAYKKDIS